MRPGNRAEKRKAVTLQVRAGRAGMSTVTEKTDWHSVQEAISPSSVKRFFALGNLLLSWRLAARTSVLPGKMLIKKHVVRSVFILEGLEVLMTLPPTGEPGISLIWWVWARESEAEARRPSLSRGERSQQAITCSPAAVRGPIYTRMTVHFGESNLLLKTSHAHPPFFFHCSRKFTGLANPQEESMPSFRSLSVATPAAPS